MIFKRNVYLYMDHLFNYRCYMIRFEGKWKLDVNFEYSHKFHAISYIKKYYNL